MTEATTILAVKDLSVEIERHGSIVVPVDSVGFELQRGEILGLVGESGSGKSLTLKALMGLLPRGGRIGSGEMRWSDDSTLTPFDPVDMRGAGIGMVFQEPMTALNPLIRVGDLIAEPLIVRQKVPKAKARIRAIDLMRAVGIPDPERRARAYSHELSGGLRQRIMIALALAGEPKVLLCDEPTTALDVTIQDQILGLLLDIREERGLSLVFVTHDLAVINELCDRVAVMYAGRVVEIGPVDEVFRSPQHPYTLGLLESSPQLEPTDEELMPISGRPPDPTHFPSGCRFWPRCTFALEDCKAAAHELIDSTPDHSTACIHTELMDGGA